MPAFMADFQKSATLALHTAIKAERSRCVPAPLQSPIPNCGYLNCVLAARKAVPGKNEAGKRDLMIVVMRLSRCHPFRMILLHPRMIVLNPPVSIMPLVMRVVVAHSRRWRVRVCRWPGVPVCRRRRISVRRRLRVVRMSAIKASLKRHRPECKSQCLQKRGNFAPHHRVPRAEKEHQRCQRRKAANRVVSQIVRERVSQIFRTLYQKIQPRKNLTLSAQKAGQISVLQPGQLFVV
jgi:hypothetical protein